MNYQLIQFVLEVIGTVSFAISGALLGVRRSMDIFGIIVLGVVTAVGGGMIRDVALGLIPPSSFLDSTYPLLATIVSILVFLVFYRRGDQLNSRFLLAFEEYLVFFDALGLAAFTIVGMNTAARIGYLDNRFLILFCGMITGIGGGIVRDLLAGIVPFVFIRQVYGAASLVGGAAYLASYKPLGPSMAMIIGFLVVVVVRMVSHIKRWNLPRILVEEIEERRN